VRWVRHPLFKNEHIRPKCYCVSNMVRIPRCILLTGFLFYSSAALAQFMAVTAGLLSGVIALFFASNSPKPADVPT
jgi:hypothetical protein